MLSISDFQFFEPEAEASITAGDLPHWQQAGATYFITYRTIDSISAIAMDRIIGERNDWLQRNEIDPASPVWPNLIRLLSESQQRAFRKHFSTSFERELDRLEGECLLRKENLARVVADSLRHFNGTRYRLGGFVVMPNHIHVLVGMLPTCHMVEQCYSWKHFQAHQINKVEQRKGHVFQPESFDHLVRDADHFEKFRR